MRTYVSSAKELGWEEGWGPLGPAAPTQMTYLDTWALRIDDIAVCFELSGLALSLSSVKYCLRLKLLKDTQPPKRVRAKFRA